MVGLPCLLHTACYAVTNIITHVCGLAGLFSELSCLWLLWGVAQAVLGKLL
jgi:hypothetical protein